MSVAAPAAELAREEKSRTK